MNKKIIFIKHIIYKKTSNKKYEQNKNIKFAILLKIFQ